MRSKEGQYLVGRNVADQTRRAGKQSLPSGFLADHPTGTFSATDYESQLDLVPAELRLLVVGVALLAGLFGCGESVELPPTVHTPRVAGAVVDKDSGEPVAGSEAFLWRSACCRNDHTRSGFKLRTIWTTTDDAGRFEFPAWSFEVEGKREGYRLNDGIAMFLVHPDYGSPIVREPDDPAQWESIRFEIERSLRTWERIQGGDDGTACVPLTGEAFFRCCDVAYGEGHDCGPRPES